MFVSKRVMETLIYDLNKISPDVLKNAFIDLGIEVISMNVLPEIEDLYIGEIIEVKKHPEDEKLKICVVDLGKKDRLTIVSKASNIKLGLKVVVAKEGISLPNKGKIAKKNVKGIISEGMICSLSEISNSRNICDSDVSKALEIHSFASNGQDEILEYFFLDDTIYELEFTTNRPDLQSLISLCQEISAVLNVKVQDYDIKTYKCKGHSIGVEAPKELSSIYTITNIQNVKINESDIERKNVLRASQVKPINNVVDITNLVMLYTGNPVHAYDADKVIGDIKVDYAKNEEKFYALDGKIYTLCSEDIVIRDEQKIISLAGIIGSLDTKISNDTKNIIIEIGVFNNLRVRNTIQKTLKTEAAQRSSKLISPYMTYKAIDMSLGLIFAENTSAKIYGTTNYFKPDSSNSIKVKIEKINSVIGTELSSATITKLLKNFGFEAMHVAGTMTVKPPAWRLDVNEWFDVIEEVVRSYNLKNVTPAAPISSLKVSQFNDLSIVNFIKNYFLGFSMNEVKTYNLTSFQNNQEFNFFGYENFKILNPISSQREYLRLMISPQLIDVMHNNLARKLTDIKIFEIQKICTKKENNYHFAALFHGKLFKNLISKNDLTSDYYTAKGMLESLMENLNAEIKFVEQKDCHFLSPEKAAFIYNKEKLVGFIGEVHPKLLSNTSDKPIIMEFNFEKMTLRKGSYKEPSNYPDARRDISFVLKNAANIESILAKIKNLKYVLKVEIFDFYKQKNANSLSIYLIIQSEDKTLSSTEIQSVVDQASQIIEKYDGKIR